MYLELRIATCVSMLAIASFLDLKNREVPDKIWLIFGGAGALLTIFELFFSSNGGSSSDALEFQSKVAYLVHLSIGLSIISAIGYVTYKVGFFGGADPKALAAIAVILPVYNASFQVHGFPVLSVFTNAIVVSITATLYNVCRNTILMAKKVPIFEGVEESKFRKALAFTVGYQTQSCGRFAFAMEELDNNGKKKFRFNPLSYNEFAEEDRGAKKVWVTNALPFIVYISAGFLLTVTVGDIMSRAMKLMFVH